MIYATYDKDPGPVLAVIKCSKDQLKYQEAKLIHCALDVSDETHYVESGLLAKKAQYKVEAETKEFDVVLRGVPAGTIVESEGVSAEVTDNEDVTIKYDLPGIQRVSLRGNYRYVDKDLEVTVGDS
ncbi:hypothetical protein [Vreelandella populi]|uniref:hypothetical protein n=1 Tax=Vreelandella populi TaxID=2498858 RepID=UPI000F8CCB68|nr:hypothetical protein [Halomonas populi]RUR38568.1 hypothetical protein ELY25_09405 [Halomonas populi]